MIVFDPIAKFLDVALTRLLQIVLVSITVVVCWQVISRYALTEAQFVY